MEKQIADFLADKSIENAVKIFGNKKEQRLVHTVEQLNDSAKKIYVPNAPNHFILKQADNNTGLAGIASSSMYNSVGILTPKIHLINDKNRFDATTLQQDVSEIDFLETILAGSDFEYTKIINNFYEKIKWSLFYDTNLIFNLLKFMTPECLDQLKNIFLIDELRTDIDRHTKNYFFYKQKGSDKYEGIIVIDLEQMAIYFYCEDGKDGFLNFLTTPYESSTPQQKFDYTCYMQRVRDMRELIQDDVLSENNLEILSNALNYDFPGDVKNAVQNKKLHGKAKKKIVDPIKRLWEYNQNTIGKDLGL